MEKSNIITHVEWVVTLATLIGSFYILDAKFDAKVDTINNRMDTFMIAWHEEVKDFHGRLCAIEERNRSR